jgi:aminotransferase in exopolysaccharide biosynthesis
MSTTSDIAAAADALVGFVRETYRSDAFIPLHAPSFGAEEAANVMETLESTMVSSVGAFVDRFEAEMATYIGVERAVACVNGTAALHMALLLAGVGAEDLVLTQPLTFVATCNAIAYLGAEPVFVDVDRATLSLSPDALRDWLQANAVRDDDGTCRRRRDRRAIRACLPMHSFGHPARIGEIAALCDAWGIALVEDAAESLGSTTQGRQLGSFGRIAAQSFNGNKIITTGGGGMILTDAETGARAKHLTTTAKRPHRWDYVHDAVGYNYRMPNLNAALGVAQLARLEGFVAAKRTLAAAYRDHLGGGPLRFVEEPEGARANYWLNAVICPDRAARDALLAATNDAGVMTRPIWALMTRLPMFAHAEAGPLDNAAWLEERVVNLPSSPPLLAADPPGGAAVSQSSPPPLAADPPGGAAPRTPRGISGQMKGGAV